VEREEPNQLESIKEFALAMEKAVKNENNRLISEMNEWTDSHVRQPKEEMKKFKA
jgi:uncharacterized protein (DUF305 family)